MKIYNTQAEVDADIVDGVLKVNGDVQFNFDLKTVASLDVKGNIKAENINARDIDAGDIDARNINAGDINARNIKAENINAMDIDAGDIDARNINAGDINARNIRAWDINARDINAGNISFYAACFAYYSFKCKSITGRRVVSKYFCLDSEVEFIKEPEVTEMTVAEISKALGKTVKIVE